MIYVTGDTHGKFQRITDFCEHEKTSCEDIMIILGDAGINYNGWVLDREKKELLKTLPITLFCIHGNHEQRPDTIDSYAEKRWHGGIVYWEEDYPNLLFAKDGEIFDLDGKQTIVIGGAYSIDKMIRVIYGYGWWADEQPSDEIKRYVEEQLEKRNWKIDVILSHTVPLKYEPREMFMTGVDQSNVDKSTEEKLEYQKWYCGHYHTEKKIGKVDMKYKEIEKFLL